MCSEPVADGAGYITIAYRDINAHYEAEAKWEAAHPPEPGLQFLPLEEFLSGPGPIPWRVLHRRPCDPDPGGLDYWIAVERIRDQAAVISWTAHLLGKDWLPKSNWDEILHRVVPRDYESRPRTRRRRRPSRSATGHPEAR
jgi:hypothetical protein